MTSNITGLGILYVLESRTASKKIKNVYTHFLVKEKEKYQNVFDVFRCG